MLDAPHPRSEMMKAHPSNGPIVLFLLPLCWLLTHWRDAVRKNWSSFSVLGERPRAVWRSSFSLFFIFLIYLPWKFTCTIERLPSSRRRVPTKQEAAPSLGIPTVKSRFPSHISRSYTPH